MSRKAPRKGLDFDCLESRTLLDGAIIVEMTGGNVLIRGDALNNHIIIDKDLLNPNELRITVDVDSTINGESGPLIIPKVKGSVQVELGDGDDQLVIRGNQLRKQLRVEAGAGNDIVLFDGISVSKLSRVNLGNGDDSLHIVDSHLRALIIDSGAGNDVIAIDQSELRGNLTVDAGDGDDTIYLRSTLRRSQNVDLGAGQNQVISQVVERHFDFHAGAQGWEAGFADYRDGDEVIMNLDSGIRSLPGELGATQNGFFLTGSNSSDDLFMFLKGSLGAADGVVPNQLYQVRLEIVFASNVPTGCHGIGGSPGEGVFLKAGASTVEPTTSIDLDNFVRMDVDKGNQSTGGAAASVVGNISNAVPCDQAVDPNNDNGDEPGYRVLRRTHVHEFLAQADGTGRLWLLVGTDSGFEGTTALYYLSIGAQLIPVPTVN